MTLQDINNKFIGKTAYVCGLGPSLKNYLNVLEEVKNEKEQIIISCNDVDLMTKIVPDFWVVTNSIMTVQNYGHRYNKFENTTFCYSDTVDLTNRDIVKEIMKINYLPFDSRHFENKNCNLNICCHHRIENRLTIQEFVQKKCNYFKHYSTGHTVAIHMLALAIILGCSPIYIIGVDLDYTLGYVDGITTNKDSFNVWNSEIISDFEILRDSAKNIGIEIKNLSEFSKLKDIF